jgi:glycosyltransferase involved in cell wall biosynthesis
VTRRAVGRVRGRALLAYLRAAAGLDNDAAAVLGGHSNQWESRLFAVTLSHFGFDVDVIDFDDRSVEIRDRYDVVVAIDGRLLELASMTRPGRALIHLTGSYPPFQNAAERRRLDELQARRGVVCAPRRTVADEETFVQALHAADACSLLGNPFTLSTFPDGLRPKMTLLPVTGSRLRWIKSGVDLVPETREFLWFFGSGAVHKGLDRVLEAFARRPDLTLHVVGNIAAEHDFLEAFSTELSALDNIHYHGMLDPQSDAFVDVLRRCVAFVAPSCSESTSTAAVTMLQAGLFPILSRETGVSLPASTGLYLDTCSADEIEAAATDVFRRPRESLLAEIDCARSWALTAHSRDRFATELQRYLHEALA